MKSSGRVDWLIDFREFLKWMNSLQGEDPFIPHAKLFEVAHREKRWESKDISGILKYMHKQGMIRIGDHMEISLNRSRVQIPLDETSIEDSSGSERSKRRMKKKDPDAYLQQQELTKWVG